MMKEFDRVKHTDDGRTGMIMEVDSGCRCYVVLWDNQSEVDEPERVGFAEIEEEH